MLVAISKQRRRAFMIVAILLWVTILPLLLLYASGYRINVGEFTIEQTGSLLLKSYPRSADVLIDNKLSTKTTPALLNTLKPGHHTFEVSMPNRFSWNMDVVIEPKKTFEYSDIVLFLKDQVPKEIAAIPEAIDFTTAIHGLDPKLQYALDSQDISAEAIAWRNGDSPIAIYDPASQEFVITKETGNEFTLHNISSKAVSFDWIALRNAFIYNTQYEISIVNTDFDQQTILRQGTPIGQVKWYPRGGYVVFSTDSTIEILETRLTDTPNRYTVYNGATPSNITISGDGTLLYFSTPDKKNWELRLI